MILPFSVIFIIVNVALLILGVREHKLYILFLLIIIWLLGSFFSLYFVIQVWMSRMYSENWAMLGFFFFTVPYAIITGCMIGTELFFIKKWEDKNIRILRYSLIFVLLFLIFQLLFGIATH
jgi:disulfide bond formation protein DsbB